MPRKKRTIIDEVLPESSSLLTSDGESISFDDIPMDEMLSTFGEEPFLMKVYKVTPSGSSFVYSTTDKPDASTFESSIQDRCPSGGKFVVRFYKNNRILEPSRHVEIEPRAIINLPANGANDVAQVQIRMMQENLSMFQNMIMAFIGRPTPINAAPTPMNELVTMMTALAAMNGQKSDIDTLMKGIELSKSLGSNASPDWKSEAIHTVKEVLAPVAGVIAQSQLKAPLQSNTPVVHQQQISERTNNDMLPVVKMGLSTLKPKILSGVLEPGLAVDWILANATDISYQPFLTLALQGDINTIIGIDPDFANEPYKSWMTTVIDMVKGAYADTNKADNERGVRNNSNITDNEIPSTGFSPIQKAM